MTQITLRPLQELKDHIRRISKLEAKKVSIARFTKARRYHVRDREAYQTAIALNKKHGIAPRKRTSEESRLRLGLKRPSKKKVTMPKLGFMDT